MAVIDFHSHILPGIDDGSRSTEMSMKMLEIEQRQGVEVILATPHFYASRHRIETFIEKRKQSYERLMEIKGDFGPQIKLGAEVAFFPGISQAERIDSLAVEGSSVLLLEMPFEPWTESVMQEVLALAERRKMQVILAHLERYMGVPENQKYISKIFDMPLYVQINAESLLSWRKRRPLLKMFGSGSAHFLGSDCHDLVHRIPNLESGREKLRKKFGEAFLMNMDLKGSELLELGGKGDV